MTRTLEAQYKARNNTDQKTEKDIYCAVSIDGDLRLGNLSQQKEGIHAMREAHSALGILGKTSWFINENDFHWTEDHPEILLDLVETGESIGIHDHLDTHYLEDQPVQKIYEFISLSWHRINDFYTVNGKKISIHAHRNGCAMQGRNIYNALGLMGYSILSDVWPGMKWYSRMIPTDHPLQPWKSLDNEGDVGTILTDNSQIPLIAVPWRHGEDNWLDVNSREGIFLQVPITCLPWVDRNRIHAAVENSGQQAFLVIDTHPYNLQNSETGNVSRELVNDYCNILAWIKETYNVVFIRMDQIPQLLRYSPEMAR